jgi:photosystem II stability/assembly factor-like uncharacterized protein
MIFTSSTEGWVCDSPVRHTADGGQTWQETAYRGLVRAPTPRACAAAPGGDLWLLIGSTSATLLPIQGGSDLAVTIGFPRLPAAAVVTQIAFADDVNGWVLARTPGDGPGHGFLYRTTEGGVRFALVSSDAPVNGVQFADSNNGWGIGDGQLEHTTDGGATWKPVTVPPESRPLLEGVFVDGSRVVTWGGTAVAARGAGDDYSPFFDISTDGGRTWSLRRGPESVVWSGSSRSGFFVPVDAQHWRLAFDSRLWITDDGGNSWEERPPLPFEPASLAFPTPDSGWATARQGPLDSRLTVFRTTDAGRTWNRIDTTPQPVNRNGVPVGIVGVPDGCPSAAVTAVPAGDARAAVVRAARDYLLRQRGWTTEQVANVYPVGDTNNTYGEVFALNVPKYCGRAVAQASYGVELENPQITQSSARSTALVVGHFADGWRVWGFYR